MESVESLSVVIPTYNEEARLEATLRRLSEIADAFRSLEVIISDDGSTDRTLELASRWMPSLSIQTLENPHLGPGSAIRAGVLASRYDWVLLSDADGPVDFETVHPMLSYARTRNLDLVSGRRIGPNARIAHPQPVHRRFMGHLWRQFVRHGIGAPFTDPQCGFKVFRGESARRLFRATESASFGIHVETMMLASATGYRIDEYPVSWGDRDGSKIRPIRDSIEMVAEAFNARRRIQKSARLGASRSAPTTTSR